MNYKIVGWGLKACKTGIKLTTRIKDFYKNVTNSTNPQAHEAEITSKFQKWKSQTISIIKMYLVCSANVFHSAI